jgi:hypothetical protein
MIHEGGCSSLARGDIGEELAYLYTSEGACLTLTLVAWRKHALTSIAAAALERGALDKSVHDNEPQGHEHWIAMFVCFGGAERIQPFQMAV